MTDKEAIKFHLTNSYNQKGNLTYFSGFCGALKDARKMTGRNMDTGNKDGSNTFGHLGSWLGTIGYLSLLDQVGNCFKKINGPSTETNKSGIIKALKNFSNFNDDEIDAIYALRNSFAHDYSVQNIGNRPGLTHHFLVDNSDYNPAVILPLKKWDGLSINRTKENITYMNLQAIGDATEQVVKNIIRLADRDEVEITLEGGSKALIARYSFVTGAKVL